MGLDMYLYKKTYIGNKYKKPEDRVELNIAGVKTERISYVEEQVLYWRKANQIHQWFVENCQEGNDDCGEHYVEREQLEELLGIIKKILKNCKLVDGKIEITGYSFDKKSNRVYQYIDGKIMDNYELAQELLPTQEGFFFGGTGYDQYYIDDLKYTKKELTKLLKEEDTGEFYYNSSW